jgi:flagellar hook assembly protein FlgD
VHNLAGEQIARIYDQRDLSGPNEVAWDGRNDAGEIVPPGLYLIRLSADTDAGKATEMRSVAVVY